MPLFVCIYVCMYLSFIYYLSNHLPIDGYLGIFQLYWKKCISVDILTSKSATVIGIASEYILRNGVTGSRSVHNLKDLSLLEKFTTFPHHISVISLHLHWAFWNLFGHLLIKKLALYKWLSVYLLVLRCRIIFFIFIYHFS